MKIVVGKEYSFEAAHYLEGHPRCHRMHGHTYVVVVEVVGDVREDGMVIDFHELNSIVGPVLRRFDHTCINEAFALAFGGEERVRPTAENVVGYIAQLLSKDIECDTPGRVRALYSVQVWEGAKAWARWERGVARHFERVEDEAVDGNYVEVEDEGPSHPDWDPA